MYEMNTKQEVAVTVPLCNQCGLPMIELENYYACGGCDSKLIQKTVHASVTLGEFMEWYEELPVARRCPRNRWATADKGPFRRSPVVLDRVVAPESLPEGSIVARCEVRGHEHAYVFSKPKERRARTPQHSQSVQGDARGK